MDRAFFFQTVRTAFGPLKQTQVDGLNEILDLMERLPTGDVRFDAYFLATVKRECGDTWKPITEWGPVSYFNKYEPGTRIGKVLGNTVKGDGYRLRGHGYTQTTGRRNFIIVGTRLGLPLVDNPELLLVPENAYRASIVAMTEGLYTGKKVSDYLTPTKCDYLNLRRVINGLDRAQEIAANARVFEKALRGPQTREAPAPTPTPRPELPPTEPRPGVELIAEAVELLNRFLGRTP